MKNILEVSYIYECDIFTKCEYDVDGLEAGQHVVGNKFSFDIIEKKEDTLTVQCGCRQTINVTKNGDIATLYINNVEMCDDGSRFDVLESLHFCWKTKEE